VFEVNLCSILTCLLQSVVESLSLENRLDLDLNLDLDQDLDWILMQHLESIKKQMKFHKETISLKMKNFAPNINLRVKFEVLRMSFSST
jgi:hypothetical protein